MVGQGKQEVDTDDVELSSAVSDSLSDRLRGLQQRRSDARFLSLLPFVNFQRITSDSGGGCVMLSVCMLFVRH